MSIVLCGEAGQGVQTVESLLTRILKLVGFHVFATKEYMSRIRGGANSTTIRLGTRRVAANVRQIDLLVALNEGAMEHVAGRIEARTVVLGEQGIPNGWAGRQESPMLVNIPLTQIAGQIGDKVYSNVVAVGAVLGLLDIDIQEVVVHIRQFFSRKPQSVIDDNVRAAEAGYQAAQGIELPDGFRLGGRAEAAVAHELVLSGAEAVSLGALAGGCDFIAAYPMSPSTGVLTFLSQHAREFDLIAEQAEDEIAAINMAIGAWYAGARALVSTSGGGFALMIEGVSLAGMLESPLVIHLAQRPAPATGLPTRTEQADLEMALYAGHGEFPRIILAPGTIEEGFYLTGRAFNLADKYQVPVFVLTDQCLMDSYYNVPRLDLSGLTVQKHVVRTVAGYRRYELTQSGISPRGIPGCGDGLVGVDSDEHDESGHITEDLCLRTRMVDKRLAKGEALKGEAIAPELFGPEGYQRLVICWGSTYHVVREALARLGLKDAAMLHYKQVYPLHPDTARYVKKARKTVVVEGNATGQFRKLIRVHAGVEVDESLLKYDGLGFAVEDIIEGLEKAL
jgi:2-oxoglutarate ferredoxin oxidoreductase subunit alpha